MTPTNPIIADAIAALEPFAATAELDTSQDESNEDFFSPMSRFNKAKRLTVGDLRRAQAAVASLRSLASAKGESVGQPSDAILEAVGDQAWGVIDQATREGKSERRELGRFISSLVRDSKRTPL